MNQMEMERLQNTEQWFKAILDNAPINICLKDSDGRFIWVNRNFEKDFGVRASDVIGKGADTHLKGEALTLAQEHDRAILTTGQATTQVEEIEGRFYRVLKCPVFDEESNPIAIVGFDTDITDLIHAEAGMQRHAQELEDRVKERTRELEESRERFKDLVEVASDWFWEMDDQLRFTYFSENFESKAGTPEGYFLGKTRQEIFAGMIEQASPHERERWENHFRDLAARRPFRNFESKWHLPDGSTRYIRNNGKPVFTSQGKFLGYRGTATKFTREMEMKQALASSEERFRSLAENSPAAIVLLDGEQRILLANNRFDEWFGQPGGFLSGGILAGALPREAADILTALSKNVLEQNRPVENEGEILLSDGNLHRIATTLFPVQVWEGSGMQVGIRMQDVTSQREAEVRLRQSQKMDALGQLTGGVMHDFNDLLQVIGGWIEVVKAQMHPAEKSHQHLEIVLQTVEKGANLTQHLLTFSPQQALRPQNVNLNAVIDELVKLLSRLIEEHIELKISKAESLPPVLADPGMIEQVLLNLCINARDAMPDGGKLAIKTEQVSLEEAYGQLLGVSHPGEYVQVTISDTGHGMSKELQEHIFEPYFTTKDSGEGTGLGLSTAYGIMKQHNGIINVYSEEGSGSTFRIYLPVSEAGTVAEAKMDQAPRIPAVPGESRTLLVVEDDANIRLVLEVMLTMAGHRVFMAEDGDEALQVFEAHSDVIELVLLDMILPKMNGRDVHSHLSKMRPDLRFIVSSGYNGDMMDMEFAQTEGLIFIQKPYDPEALMEAIQGVMGDS